MDGVTEIVEYGVCAEYTDGQLAGAVNEQIKKGWQPWGQPYTTVQYDILFFHQAMVRYGLKKVNEVMQNNKSNKMQSKKLPAPPVQEELEQGSDEIVTPAPEETNTGQGKATASEETKDRKCRICGCTDDNCSMCIKLTGEPCHWVEDNLCSACVDAMKFNNGEREDLKQTAEVVEPSVPQVFEPANFFQQLFPLLDGVHLTIRAKRINGALVVEVLPNTAVTMKSVELKGSAVEIDEAFFQHVTGPITAAQGLAVEEKEVATKPEKKNTPTTRRPSVKRQPLKKSAKPAVKKAAKPKPEKKKIIKEKTVKPTAPDLFAGL